MLQKVFFGSATGVWKNLFEDIKKSKDIEYCDFHNKCKSPRKTRFLFGKSSLLIPTKIKLHLYKKILKYKFLRNKKSDQYMFIFTNGFEMFADTYIIYFLNFLRKAFPKNSYFCLHIYESLINNPSSLVPQTIPYFDLVYTFNKYDAEKFGLHYYGGVCEYGTIQPTGIAQASDVFYSCGIHSVERFEFVLETFKTLSDKNKKCIFFVTSFTDEFTMTELQNLCNTILCTTSATPPQEIHYKHSVLFLGQYIPYSTNLAYLQKTKCTLEIVLPIGFASCTCRTAQALPYGVKILTNCPTVLEEPYYNSNNIYLYNSPKDLKKLTDDFFSTPFIPVDKNFTALHMIQEMEKELKI